MVDMLLVNNYNKLLEKQDKESRNQWPSGRVNKLPRAQLRSEQPNERACVCPGQDPREALSLQEDTVLLHFDTENTTVKFT